MSSTSFQEALRLHVARRAPSALILFASLALLGATFEILSFSGRGDTLLLVDLLFAAIVGGGLWWVRRWPERSVEILVPFVALAGAAIAFYHGWERASAEGCLLVMTALLSAVILFFPWGWRAQLVASSGVAIGFPLALLGGMPAALSLSANLSFAACVIVLSCWGSEMNRQQLSRDFHFAQALHRREARLRSYLDQALIGVGVLDRAGRWIEANEALASLLGYRREELVRRCWSDVSEVEGSDPEAALEALCRECSEGASVDRRLRARDGGVVHVCVSARCFRDESGRVEEVLLMVLDITRRKRTEAELQMAKDVAEAAYRSKSEFLAHMSHELRTPMNVIFGMTEMVLDSEVSGEQREQLLTTRRAARDLLVLVDEVLDLSRIEAGRLHLTEREFPLRQWLAQTIGPLSLLAREKGLELEWHVAADVQERAVGDPDRLRQVLVNLVANAIKFTDAGRIGIEVSRNDGAEPRSLCFTVEDTGVGIPVEQRTSIFEAFVQGVGRERPSPGTGLGLTICSRLVDLMGGRIWVESEVGRGSRFKFTAQVAGAGAGEHAPS